MLLGERWFIDIVKGGKITFTKGNIKYVLMLINKHIDIITTYFLLLREIGLIDDRIKDYIRKNNIKGNTINYLRGNNVKEFIGLQMQTILN